MVMAMFWTEDAIMCRTGHGRASGSLVVFYIQAWLVFTQGHLLCKHSSGCTYESCTFMLFMLFFNHIDYIKIRNSLYHFPTGFWIFPNILLFNNSCANKISEHNSFPLIFTVDISSLSPPVVSVILDNFLGSFLNFYFW